MKFRPIFWMTLLYASGILLSSQFTFPLWGIALCLLCLAAAIVFHRRQIFFWVATGLFVMLAGWIYCGQIQNAALLKPGEAIATGILESVPIATHSSKNGSKLRGDFFCQTIQYIGQEPQAVNQKLVLTFAAQTSPLHYDDLLRLQGTVLESTPAKNPGAFNGQAYLKRSRYAGRFNVKPAQKIEVLARNQAPVIFIQIHRSKLHFLNLFKSYLELPHRAIASAMVLGNREEIPDELNNAFVKSATAHILAISGGNVGLIALLAFALLRLLRLPRRGAYALTIVVILVYCLLTGSDASILRATIMITLYLLGFVLGRRSEALNAWSWSAFLILLVHPQDLFNAGFQLSFLTVLFLIIGGNAVFSFDTSSERIPLILQSWKDKLKEKILLIFKYVAASFNLSLVAWLATIPLITSYFYMISPISIISNLIIVPLASVILSCALAFLSLANLSHFLGEILAQALWILIEILIRLCHFFAQIPFGTFRYKPFSAFEYVVYYLPFLLWLFKNYWPYSKTRWQILALLCLNILVWRPVFFSNAPQNLRITFLDVGHGDAALIEFPRKGNLLIDSGMGGDWNQGKLTIAPFLWSRGITHLDGVLITHPHLDHYGGLQYLLKEFSIGKVFDNGARDVPEYEALFARHKIARHSLNRGDSLEGCPLGQISVLHPPQNWSRDYPINDQSLVISLKYGRQSVLLAGDAEEFALQELCRFPQDIRANLLKAPHHGSFEKNASAPFFALVHPQTAILSEAAQNVYHLPSPQTISVLQSLSSRIYRTGTSGAITCETDGAQWNIKTQLKP